MYVYVCTLELKYNNNNNRISYLKKKKKTLEELNGFGASWQVNPSNGGSGMVPS